jgi:hypothetical protein
MRTFAIFAWAKLVLTAVSTREAAADDLVAAVLPLSRSAQIGQTVTAFATVINSFRRGVERVHGVVTEFLRNVCLSDDESGH